jgi:hypothetical protein
MASKNNPVVILFIGLSSNNGYMYNSSNYGVVIGRNGFGKNEQKIEFEIKAEGWGDTRQRWYM